MSKGKVWNKGKHNGGTGAQGGKKGKLPGKTATSSNAPVKVEFVPVVNDGGIKDNPINIVKRMNRDNWVERPARVVNKSPKN